MAPHFVTVLHHAWSSMEAQQVRLALRYKNVACRCVALGEDSTQLQLDRGIPVGPLALQRDDGTHETCALSILENADVWFGGPQLLGGVVALQDWQEFLRWRVQHALLLARLCAPALPAFADIADSPAAYSAYRVAVEQRFGMSLEALVNDRYEAWLQLQREADLKGLACRLARQRWCMAQRFSAADIVLACDLFPLQLIDGVSVPLDLLYYIERVEQACGASPREGLAGRPAPA